MKPKAVIILAVIFFVLFSTMRIWEMYLSIFGMFAIMGLYGCGLLLCVFFLVQLFKIARERFSSKQRNISTAVLAASLGLAFLFPRGMLTKDLFRADDMFVAFQEGTANCKTYLHLKADSTFVKDGYCFGSFETTGSFRRKGDTIYFENISGSVDRQEEMSHAIFYRNKKTDTITGIGLFRHADDSFPNLMHVTMNKLLE